MGKEILKDYIKKLPNEIILLSYYQTYCETCKNDKYRKLHLEGFAPYDLPHHMVPNLFKYLLDAKEQFKVYDNLRSLDKEKLTEKERALSNSELSNQLKIELLEQINKDYDGKELSLKTLWDFIVTFNKNLATNSSSQNIDLLKTGKPIARYFNNYSDKEGLIIATQNLVFAIQKEPWGNHETLIYTKDDKEFYNKLFKNSITKTINK